MKANNLSIAELIQFSPGFVGLQGRRLLIHDLSSLGQFRRDLIESVGSEMARRILTRKGLFWGQADCAAMQRVFTWDSHHELLKAVPELVKIMGLAYAEISRYEWNEKKSRFAMEVTCADSAEVEQHRNELGKADRPICWVIAGYLSGFCSYCLGKPIYFEETQCQGTEASACLFVGKDIDGWGKGFDKHLPYFLDADIRGKVEQLTRRVREKQQALALGYKQTLLVHEPMRLSGIEVRSKAFRNVLDLANRVARFDTTVLITGETGTGKEVIARYIHESSKRKENQFLAVNCSALPEALLENELFGHKAGAFTGAKSSEPGLFEAAQKGTIFLDEIGDISPAIQAKLLRVLQSKEIRPVGGTSPQRVDVRVISATNRDLEALVKQGVFREDLMYRLKVVHIHLPPLRERPEDILPLARYFLGECGRRLGIDNLRLAPQTLDVLVRYDWPGNVRELENALEQATVLCANGNITPEYLPGVVTGRMGAGHLSSHSPTLEKVELHHIRAVLGSHHGNRAAAAKALGISESTLYRRLREMRE